MNSNGWSGETGAKKGMTGARKAHGFHGGWLLGARAGSWLMLVRRLGTRHVASEVAPPAAASHKHEPQQPAHS
jgi:hypothetical protein